MARGPSDRPIPRDLLVRQPWAELVERLTAMAIVRLRGRPVDDARQLAHEAVRVFLDPSSTVVWDYEVEPDPRRCLGSILNGLLRNYVRVRRTKSEIATDSETIERFAGGGLGGSPEQALMQRDLGAAVLERVQELSANDPVVCQLVELAYAGVIELEEQMAELSLSKAVLYEARRRFRDRLERAWRELEA